MIKLEPDFILKHITEEMREWLEENCDNEYTIVSHMIRFRYAGPNVPLNKCIRKDGWEVNFQNDEMAMAFKLRWL